jgi:predicted phage replisome organizer
MATGKKFYWLKLDRNFFKRHDIRIIEEQTNGKDYILFYLKLLVESIDHEGSLRFSDTIPYDEKMLSVVTNTNVDVVRQAIKIFTELGLMQLCDDKTIYMTETEKMLGFETDWAKKQRTYRELKEITSGDNVPVLSPPCPHDVRQEIEIEKELDKEKEKKDKKHSADAPRTVFQKPSISDVKTYCGERKNQVDPNVFWDFYESKGWFVGKNKMKDWRACVRTWEKSPDRSGKPKKPDVDIPWLDKYMEDLKKEGEKS